MQKIRLAMGEDCAVSFEFVDEIEPTPSGKFRFTVSKLRRGDPREGLDAAPQPVGAHREKRPGGPQAFD